MNVNVDITNKKLTLNAAKKNQLFADGLRTELAFNPHTILYIPITEKSKEKNFLRREILSI